MNNCKESFGLSSYTTTFAFDHSIINTEIFPRAYELFQINKRHISDTRMTFPAFLGKFQISPPFSSKIISSKDNFSFHELTCHSWWKFFTDVFRNNQTTQNKKNYLKKKV